jgi:hypothetical protein
MLIFLFKKFKRRAIANRLLKLMGNLFYVHPKKT